jgi:hypothetical protein
MYFATALVLLLSLVFTVVMQIGNISGTRRKLRHLPRHGVSTSNMSGQYGPKSSVQKGMATDKPVHIKVIYIHPVKSCGPIEVNRALLTKAGFMYDRCFAFATEGGKSGTTPGSKWRFISQRTKPRMSQIKTELWLPHKNSDPRDPLVQAGGCVLLSFQNPDNPS